MSIGDFNQKKFIKEVRAFMKKNNLSVRVFAKMSGTSFVTLYRLEQGNNEITLTTIRKLEKAIATFNKKNRFEDLV
jgi:predicted transcriptional regulator